MQTDQETATLVDQDHVWRTLYCAHCGHSFKIPIPCKNRFCSVCSKVRLSKVRRRLTALCKRQAKSGKGQLRFLTLTITSDEDLQRMIKILSRSFRKLRQQKGWKKRVTGGAHVIEITRSEHGWHAHIHAVIAGSYFPFKSLLEMWKKCSPGHGVYIKMIPEKLVVNYLTKYITKRSDTFIDDDEYDVSYALKGLKLFNPFGQWFGWSKDLKEEHPPCPDCGSTCGYITEFDIPRPETPCFIYDRHSGRSSPVYIDPF